MKNSIFVKITTVIFLFVLIASSIISCKKKDPEPTLPPSSSMVMDVGNFWNGTARMTGTAVDTTKTNLIFAGTNVLVWNVILTVGLAVPVASFLESFKYTPTWNKKEREWVWSYSVPGGYTAELHGKANADNIGWSMYISKSGSYSDFLWYTGTSKKDNTNGQWILNESPSKATPLLQIDWNKNAIGTCDVKYKNVVPGGPENGGYINYGIVSNTQLDAFYDIYNKGKNNLTGIKWNRSSKEGRVKDMIHFKDTLWHCWNTTLFNDTCR